MCVSITGNVIINVIMLVITGWNLQLLCHLLLLLIRYLMLSLLLKILHTGKQKMNALYNLNANTLYSTNKPHLLFLSPVCQLIFIKNCCRKVSVTLENIYNIKNVYFVKIRICKLMAIH